MSSTTHAPAALMKRKGARIDYGQKCLTRRWRGTRPQRRAPQLGSICRIAKTKQGCSMALHVEEERTAHVAQFHPAAVYQLIAARRLDSFVLKLRGTFRLKAARSYGLLNSNTSVCASGVDMRSRLSPTEVRVREWYFIRRIYQRSIKIKSRQPTPYQANKCWMGARILSSIRSWKLVKSPIASRV